MALSSLEDLKKLSMPVKMMILCLVLLLLAYFFWFFYLESALEKKKGLEERKATLDQQIDEKDRIAKQRDKYLKEVQALKEAYQLALTKLPNQREIPGLFLAVAEAGREAGVEFILFEPKAAVKKQEAVSTVAQNLKPSDQRAEQKATEAKAGEKREDAAKGGKGKPAEPASFYEEIPVKVSVKGPFHSAAVFFDKVAKLPRIVNIEEITMGEGTDLKGQRVLTTSCIIKTYMFLDKADEKKKP
ncbi:MAG: type 4a pilus biogenesis protein PilO [Syntrophales bacterium]